MFLMNNKLLQKQIGEYQKFHSNNQKSFLNDNYIITKSFQFNRLCYACTSVLEMLMHREDRLPSWI